MRPVKVEHAELGQTGSAQLLHQLDLLIGIGLARQPRRQSLNVLEARRSCANVCQDISDLAPELGSIESKRDTGGYATS
jgi:hypothetical protein